MVTVRVAPLPTCMLIVPVPKPGARLAAWWKCPGASCVKRSRAWFRGSQISAHREWLVPASILMAMIGYAIGNYLAILTGRLGQLLVS